MTKVLFLLSAIVMGVAGLFAYQNRDNFIKTREDRTKNVDLINKELTRVKNLNREVGDVRDKINAVGTEITTENERLQLANLKLKNIVADGENLLKDVTAKQKTIEEYKIKLKDLPPDFSLETINENINKLKQDIATADDQAKQIAEQVTVKEGDVKKTQVKLDGVVERIEARKKLFDRNSMSATIVAVNNDWGFVVIDAGEDKSITVDTKLLVTRGTDTIGRLNIIDVSGNRTVANIDQKSLRAGTTVAPGDRVILETLYQ